MSDDKLFRLAEKQELLIELYNELLSNHPTTKKELAMLKIKVMVARKEIIKNTQQVKKSLEEIRLDINI